MKNLTTSDNAIPLSTRLPANDVTANSIFHFHADNKKNEVSGEPIFPTSFCAMLIINCYQPCF